MAAEHNREESVGDGPLLGGNPAVPHGVIDELDREEIRKHAEESLAEPRVHKPLLRVQALAANVLVLVSELARVEADTERFATVLRENFAAERANLQHSIELAQASWRKRNEDCNAALDRLTDCRAALAREQARAEQLAEAARPLVEWDFHAAGYVADFVDGEERRVIPPGILEEIIEQQERLRVALAAGAATKVCNGSRDCPATEHIHGCFAERRPPS